MIEDQHADFTEYNFDGLVGPTHNYAGLAVGNVASLNNVNTTSNPKMAALQGLEKMQTLAQLGIKQAILPPQPRPDIEFLKKLGFTGSNEKILKKALEQSPRLFAASYSASSMWTANSVTVSHSLDTEDKKVHFTPANLTYNIHRSIEAETTCNIFKRIFKDDNHFVVHNYLPFAQELGDEGAANHTRFCNDYDQDGVGLFVYGQEFFNKAGIKPKKFPARQTLEASQCIARQHGLKEYNTIFIQQNPEAIDAGVFHNDVCAVGNKNVLLCHDTAFIDHQMSLNTIKKICDKKKIDLNIINIKTSDLPVSDMVSSYLFNSQLVSLNKKEMALIVPSECAENKDARSVIDNIICDTDNPITKAIYVDCRQSMRNGGGPACLRLRVVLSTQQAHALTGNIIFNNDLYLKLRAWVEKYYRDEISFKDLLDPNLVTETYEALENLTTLLNLGPVYQFQR